MGNAMTFYRHGLANSRVYGYRKNLKEHADILEPVDGLDLQGKVFMVTGANSGIGLELSNYFAKHNGTVYMVCRNKERGTKARDDVATASANDHVHVLFGDMGVSTDVRSVVKEFLEREEALDCVICCAGTATEKRQLTSEGLESTFACHLANGSYLLTKLLVDALKKSSQGRSVLLSSGGMYSTKLPKWEVLTGQEGKHDILTSYAYQKRGQVYLSERFAEEYAADAESIKVVSCHPGWVDTPNVSKSFSAFERWMLKPLRSPWEGTHGIAYLSTAPLSALESGAFYLDGVVQTKHLVKATENTKEHVDTMMANLATLHDRLEAGEKGAAV